MDIIKKLEELGTYTVPEQNEIRWKAMAEIERLREALQEIAAWKLSPDADTPIYMANLAEDALKEKE